MLMSKKGKELVSRMPKERVLTESDGPFATFQGRQATPLDTAVAVSQLARVWGEDDEQVRGRLLENLRRLGFGDERFQTVGGNRAEFRKPTR